jgi:hypothetical protein
LPPATIVALPYNYLNYFYCRLPLSSIFTQQYATLQCVT